MLCWNHDIDLFISILEFVYNFHCTDICSNDACKEADGEDDDILDTSENKDWSRV